MQVELIGKPDISPTKLMSFAAKTCYENSKPEMGEVVNIEKRIFGTGHHSILQHSNFTFFIESIPIGNITLGLHLNTPFYVSSQRSGRFCFGMFSQPGIIEDIIKYINLFFDEIDSSTLNAIRQYIDNSTELYHHCLPAATIIARKFISQERPMATSKYLEQNSRKAAQEQLRMAIPVIFPTGVTFTINLLTLVSLYSTAWDKPMQYITECMAKKVLELYPELEYMFKRNEDDLLDKFQKLDFGIPKITTPSLVQTPSLDLLSLDIADKKSPCPEYLDMHPIDLLHSNPLFMGNNAIDITTLVHISLATTGQDQRHKTISRSLPKFSGYFYSPPIVDELDIGNNLLDLAQEWIDLTKKTPPGLSKLLAPYGAMVRYIKKGNLNAIMHEQEKRLCWCTQQEIYEISRQLRVEISKHPNCTPELLRMFSPRCFQCGKCGEGTRYCGRDLTFPNPADFFPKRKV